MNLSHNSLFSTTPAMCSDPGKAQCHPVIKKDVVSKLFYWSLSIGKSTVFSTRTKDLPIAPDLGITWDDRIYPTPLNPTLQSYFKRMEQAAFFTCHPQQIHEEAVHNASLLIYDPPPSIIENIAKRVFCAGTARIEYTRSVALLVHDIETELVCRNWDTKNKFSDALVGMTIEAFRNSWARNDLHFLNNYSGLDPVPPAMEETRTHILNTAAFLGDIFAMGLVPSLTMQSLICFLLDYLGSVTHCRALYLLLLHAKAHIATPLGCEFLITLRAIIVMQANATFHDMIRRWLIEICNVIDATFAKDAETPYEVTVGHAPVVWHRWSEALSCDSLLGLSKSVEY